ncbi:MAG: prepilin-type N-terminal cleavage/methylation domain-containing protein, partial [Candidatus Aminicenantaceae bacterium]
MFKSKKGFTLIELLIVVAIIGILAALLIPNAITAMQKAKQKATMKDVVTIATALTDHVTDNG